MLGQLSCAFAKTPAQSLTDALLGSKDKLSPKGLGDDMVGDRRVNVAGMADLLAGRRLHLSTGAKCLPTR